MAIDCDTVLIHAMAFMGLPFGSLCVVAAGGSVYDNTILHHISIPCIMANTFGVV